MTETVVIDAAKIREEIEDGGTESPCPFCRLPRCRRSDYLRCARCGVNWMNGEALDKDPRIERLNKFLADNKAMVKAKKEEKSES